MRTRKIMALLLTAVMLLGLLAACGPTDQPVDPGPGQTDTNTPAPPPPPQGQQPGQTTPPPAPETPSEPPMVFNSKVPRDTFIIGTPAMNGDFISGFGNSSYDLSIKTLTGGHCETYYQTPGGQISLNPTIVKDVSTTVDAAGNKTYTFELHNDIKWNDGSAITAKDYVAGILLYASSQFAAVGVSSTVGDGIVGYGAYLGGDTDTFAGIQLLGDYRFSATIDAEELPYFWETAYVAFSPIPLAVWLPGISIVSGAGGASFSGDISAHCQRLSETERYAPTVSCGPYKFISSDGSTVTMQRNPHFKGDPDGNKPSFEWVIQMEVPEATDVDMVISGDIDLNAGNIEGSKIEAARASEFAVAHSYLRAGFGFIGFPTDWGTTADPNVRWAIAHMIDRNAIIDHVLEGYGGIVDAAFGMAQWTYQERRRELAQRLTPIAFNLDKAHDFLDNTEWVFEADGSTKFDRTKVNAQGTYMRHNAAGEMLVVRHLSAALAVGGAIESETLKNSPLIGMRYEVTHGDFSALLDHYYYGDTLGDERYYNAFNLASNFSAVDDKYWSWHSDQADTWQNANSLRDDTIDRLTMEMRKLDPTDTNKFADLWVEFQVRWQELLPSFPLYSNEYFDIHNSVVISVPTTPYANYQDVICQIHKWP